jgi:hypothetical protein
VSDDDDRAFRREWLGRQVDPTPVTETHPLPWRFKPHADETPYHVSTTWIVLDAKGKFVCECSSVHVADFIVESARQRNGR